jgi:hypothetical protein
MLDQKLLSGTKKLREFQRNLSGEIIEEGEMVKVRQSKEDPNLIDITSVSSPKRSIRNVPPSCVE